MVVTPVATSLIQQDLLVAGFTEIEIEMIELSSRVNARDGSCVWLSPAGRDRATASALGRAAYAVAKAPVPWDGKDALMSAHLNWCNRLLATVRDPDLLTPMAVRAPLAGHHAHAFGADRHR